MLAAAAVPYRSQGRIPNRYIRAYFDIGHHILSARTRRSRPTRSRNSLQA